MNASLVVKNPYNGEILQELEFATQDQVALTLQRADTAGERWRKSSSFKRSELISHAATQLENRSEEFAQLICAEAGKPIAAARGEVARGIGVLKWASAEALRFSGEVLNLDTTSSGRDGFGIHRKFPRGVILGITPFNFPLNLVLHKVAPAVAVGCSIIIKPSPSTPLTALKLAELFAEEKDLVQIILADDEGTAGLTRASQVAMISFTGSAQVGWLIRKQAPEKPTTLELGGNAWVSVFEDTPESQFAKVAARIASGGFGYAGQSCISVQNVAVAHSIWVKFSEYLMKATLATVYGDPREKTVLSGPVIRARDAERIKKLISSAKGKIESNTSRGNIDYSTMIAPTLITVDEKDQSPLTEEEAFGPLMTARPFHSMEEWISQVNSSRYGLQAGVFTQDFGRIQTLYRDLKVGGVIVNDVPTTRYDHQPYGGVKDSGQGREGVRYAMEEMTESKFLALSSIIPG